MIILGIETSCDETALSLVEADGETGDVGIKMLGESLISQVEIHKEYGGVFPMIAKREHSRNLIPLLEKLLSATKLLNRKLQIPNLKQIPKSESEVQKILGREPELLKQFLEFIPTVKKPAIDAIAVTVGPGLEPALWVGLNFAYALKEIWGVPVIPVNHMEGHIFAGLVQKYNAQNINHKTQIEKNTLPDSPSKLHALNFPAIALLISGGHTELVLVKDWLHYEIIGQTRDDAVGEAFDKVARILGLPYPGGPEISGLAEKERQLGGSTSKLTLRLPRPMITSDNLDFSFSGLKTAVLYMVKKIPTLTGEIKREIAREFEDAVTEVLISKTKKAIEIHGAQTLILGGGVIANIHIREEFEKLSKEIGIEIHIPDQKLTTDNAIMIAVAGYFHAIQNKSFPAWEEIRADGNLRLSHGSSKIC